MFFKFMYRAFGLSLTLTIAGCGVKLGEKAPEQSPVSYSGKSYSCVSQIPQNIQKYVNDELNDGEINEFMRCLQNAFSSFAQYTRGREESNYGADEIRNFLQKSFIKDRTISDELLHEFMVIKQALVGGDNENVARTELFEAIQFIDDLRAEAIRLRPHIKILNPRLVAQQDAKDLGKRLTAANSALKESIQVIASHLQKSKKVYPLANLEAFVTEFRDFVNWEEHFKSARPVPKWIALIKAFKSITVSPQEPEVIHEADWVPLMESMSNWYLAYLQYRVGVENEPVLYGTGLQNLRFLANQVSRLLRDAVENHQPSAVITFEQMNQLVIAMHDLGWIPEKMRTSSLDHALQALVTRVAGDYGTKPTNRFIRGLDVKSIANLEFEFFRWADVQANLDSRFRSETPVVKPVPKLQPPMNLSPDVRAKIAALEGSDWDEFSKIRTMIRPLFLEDSARVMLVPEADIRRYGLKHGFYNLSMMNVLRSSVALVFRGYAEGGPSRWMWESGISGAEMQKFYEDFRDVGIDLGFVDKRNTNSGSRAFIEGKLFTSSSTGFSYNGKGKESTLSFIEAMEYFAYLFSGGQQAKDIFSQLMTECQLGPVDINGLVKVSRGCALARMPVMIEQYLGNMPYLQDYLKSSSVSTRSAYSKVIIDTAYSPTASEPEWIEKNEVSTMAVVVSYAESVMNRFDKNRDGKLENSELEGAVKNFSGFIKKIGKDRLNRDFSDAQARAAFFYILTYKTIPETKVDFAYVMKFEVWEPTLSLDRMQLAEVFKAIIGRLFDVGKNQAIPILASPISICQDPQGNGCVDKVESSSSITTH